jgi:hypothetical protein
MTVAGNEDASSGGRLHLEAIRGPNSVRLIASGRAALGARMPL